MPLGCSWEAAGIFSVCSMKNSQYMKIGSTVFSPSATVFSWVGNLLMVELVSRSSCLQMLGNGTMQKKLQDWVPMQCWSLLHLKIHQAEQSPFGWSSVLSYSPCVPARLITKIPLSGDQKRDTQAMLRCHSFRDVLQDGILYACRCFMWCSSFSTCKTKACL